MDWNCTLTEERLSDLLDASILPDEAAAYSAHAAGCARCAKLVAQVGGLVTRMQRSALVEEPPTLVEKILDATLGSRKQTKLSPGWSGWLSAIWQPRFAMGLVTAAASLVIVAQALGSAAGKSSMNPVNLVRGANRQAHLTYAHGVKFVNDLRVVYEIQSRLSSQPESFSEPISVPAANPSVKPEPGHEQQQPSNDPHEKSQTVPHSIRRDARAVVELAVMLPDSFSENWQTGALRRNP
jgi:hypothetical protein